MIDIVSVFSAKHSLLFLYSTPQGEIIANQTAMAHFDI